MEFIAANELAILRWLHIIAMVYWLGGEWGVFQTSYNVVNPRLSIEERKRHMETAYRIDILARTGIILLLPLGLHMGYLWGVQPFGGAFLWAMWIALAAWLALCWAAFFARETDRGIRLTRIDEGIRFVIIPLLLISGFSTIAGIKLVTVDGEPRTILGSEPGQLWYAAKVTLYGVMLILGLGLRFIMRGWTVQFRKLAEGPDPVAEAALDRGIRQGRMIAYFYWIGIATVAFFGAVKPF
jgi:hypothetical protein